jgi:ABC-type Zn uptake system ZnuABC Zn-binding protein ZnuA
MVHNIEHALSELDPANAETYEANAEAYQTQLEELDAWVKAQIESIPAENREMVTDHDAFGYYADRYGLEVIGAVIPAISTGAEPSAADLAALQAAIADLDARAIFVGTTVNPKLAEQVARDSGIQLVPLYTGSLGQAGSGVESYLDFIRANTMAIVEALK